MGLGPLLKAKEREVSAAVLVSLLQELRLQLKGSGGLAGVQTERQHLDQDVNRPQAYQRFGFAANFDSLLVNSLGEA